MATISLAMNYITATDPSSPSSIFVPVVAHNSGHLQFVYRDGINNPREIEVQAPTLITVGDWQYPAATSLHGRNDNDTDYVNIDGTPTNANRYASTELTLRPGQTAEHVWELMGQMHASFAEHGLHINYDVNQNSNSYATAILNAIGIPLTQQLLGTVTPADVRNTPGAFVDVLQNGAKETALLPTLTPIVLEVAGTAGND